MKAGVTIRLFLTQTRSRLVNHNESVTVSSTSYEAQITKRHKLDPAAL